MVSNDRRFMDQAGAAMDVDRMHLAFVCFGRPASDVFFGVSIRFHH